MEKRELEDIVFNTLETIFEKNPPIDTDHFCTDLIKALNKISKSLDNIDKRLFDMNFSNNWHLDS
jgi:hypothetical protein